MKPGLSDIQLKVLIVYFMVEGIVKVIFALTIRPFLAGVARAQTNKPNILFIVSDDTGWGILAHTAVARDAACRPPNIDRLASHEMTFFPSTHSQVAHLAALLCRPGAFRTPAE